IAAAPGRLCKERIMERGWDGGEQLAVDRPPDTVEDALADRVESRRGPASPWGGAVRGLGAVDRAVYQAVARTPTANLDGPVRRISQAADHSRLWLGAAAAIALLGGRRGRRAALEGIVSI